MERKHNQKDWFFIPELKIFSISIFSVPLTRLKDNRSLGS